MDFTAALRSPPVTAFNSIGSSARSQSAHPSHSSVRFRKAALAHRLHYAIGSPPFLRIQASPSDHRQSAIIAASCSAIGCRKVSKAKGNEEKLFSCLSLKIDSDLHFGSRAGSAQPAKTLCAKQSIAPWLFDGTNLIDLEPFSSLRRLIEDRFVGLWGCNG